MPNYPAHAAWRWRLRCNRKSTTCHSSRQMEVLTHRWHIHPQQGNIMRTTTLGTVPAEVVDWWCLSEHMAVCVDINTRNMISITKSVCRYNNKAAPRNQPGSQCL
mmetsp:Transcript_288/g.576  ORF Transcript_288/g.576 Transcript_288/m.576 type:complete len:105 (-) Transcript_288:598-912(-)